MKQNEDKIAMGINCLLFKTSYRFVYSIKIYWLNIVKNKIFLFISVNKLKISDCFDQKLIIFYPFFLILAQLYCQKDKKLRLL